MTGDDLPVPSFCRNRSAPGMDPPSFGVAAEVGRELVEGARLAFLDDTADAPHLFELRRRDGAVLVLDVLGTVAGVYASAAAAIRAGWAMLDGERRFEQYGFNTFQHRSGPG